jgi:2-methylisocitrate lyase-like PEP mutase family enzyme
VVPNPWDAGSACVLAMLGFQALATTSSGFAATLARLDGSVTRDEALAHAAHLVAAVDVPITADLENGFADEPAAVAVTVAAAAGLGLAGCSIEDNGDHGIYDPELAADRVAAAVEAAAGRLILTARADNFLHDRNDLADTITRLQRYQDAGADVLYAPGLTRREDIAAVIHSVDRPVNVLLLPDGPTVTELATLGVSRVSIGGTFIYSAFGALAQAAKQLHGPGPYAFWDRAAEGRDLIQASLAAHGG